MKIPLRLLSLLSISALSGNLLTAEWPMSSGPFGNYLPLPAEGFEYIDDPKQVKQVWESEVDHFGVVKSLSNMPGKFFDFQRRHPGMHSGSGATPVVAEGIVFGSSYRPAGSIEKLQHPDRIQAAIDSNGKKFLERGGSKEELAGIAERLKLMVREDGEDIFFALDAKTGKVIWEVFEPGFNPLNGKRDIWKPSPAYQDGSVFALSTTGVVWALELKTGKVLWKTRIDGMAEQIRRKHYFELDLVAMDGRVVVPTYSNPIGLDAKTGKIVWKFDPKERIQGFFANASVWKHEGKSYLFYTDGGRENATHRLVDPVDGKIIWEHQSGGPQQDHPLVVGDIAFVSVDGQKVKYNKKGKDVEAWMGVRGGLRLSLEGPEVAWSFPKGDLQYTYEPGPDKGVRRNCSAGHGGVIWYFPNGSPHSPRSIYKIVAETGEILTHDYQAASVAQGGYTKAPYVYQIGDHLLHFPSGAGGDGRFGVTNFRRADNLKKVGDGIPFNEWINPTSGYEIFVEHPIVDGHIFIRTTKGTLVCYDLRKPMK